MKLLFYISTMQGGGAERVMSVICNKFAERGHDVWLATELSYPVAYPLHENVRIVDTGVSVNGKPGRLRYTFISRIKKIRAVARDVKPDVAISFMYATTALVLFALKGLKIPVIASEHTNFQQCNLSKCEQFVRLCILRFADRVTVLTQADTVFLGRKLPRKTVMPNPLSYPVYEKDSESRRKNILAVGSIARWRYKGFDSLIEIWSGIAPRYPEWTLEIAGGGKEAGFEYLRNIAAMNGVEDRVNFMGFIGNIGEVMRGSSIFVLSSRYEGLPMALVEAMSQGCACVSYDCTNGPREIIVDEKSGLLVADQNKEELKKALIRVIEDGQLRERLSREGRQEAKKFEPDAIADKWEELFSMVMD